MLKGTSASPGVAMGNVLVVKKQQIEIAKKLIQDIEAEKKRLSDAVEKSKIQLNDVKEKALGSMESDKAQIFEAHLMVLEDPELIDASMKKIEAEKINAEYAIDSIENMYLAIFADMEDEYMKERAADIKDVCSRIKMNILGIESTDLSALDKEVIIVAHDLTPSDTATMGREKVLGFLTDVGGRTSHSAIMARTLQIPAVVGLKDITSRINDNDYIIFNGETGEVIINPSSEEIEKYKKLKSDYEQNIKALGSFIDRETMTTDGRKVEIAANIGTPKDVTAVLKNGAEGVGLYRTEFLYMDRSTMPTEEEQFEAYSEVLKSMSPRPVIIRTLDIGGDKKLPYLEIDEEMNPFLGLRAIRLCLDRKDIFKTQLRALLRASVYGNLRIMFPMISNVSELLEAKSIIEEIKAEFDADDIPYSKDYQVGIMIEVPAAAMISDLLAKHVDFFSIGTNDLIQYTCAVDRMNEKISYLYNPFNPAVLRLIKLVIDNAHKAGKWVGMCGEAAGDVSLIPILLGMGLDEFSMSPISILPARKTICSLNYDDMKNLIERINDIETPEEIKAYTEKTINK
ncbi:phosphoenolpyruvate--protein phosphotransferase [Clostridium oryzae]|uniref:Phosphoenolpyruvate-protein phosphotransferase n=1 Tax=Clostridium oryzae TaxID=1450648 RepID=A0A1V4IDG1_9CLOT|nr:phosphoenolpyruvate--protein phosphotransferase [Clostridium oryzae]OPJ57983.1 phosphoenolpyruvate-protein phosphotransferase [Clostridium oryzae]